jgi:TolB protein
MANDGTLQTRISSFNQEELNPAWNAKGTKIAFERHNGRRPDIWVSNADGSNPVQLTNDPANDLHPSWNPAGKRLVFASDRAGTEGVFDIYMMDANGKNVFNITHTPTINEKDPSWSPDGTAIAFSRDGDIYKSTPGGTSLKRLTTDPAIEDQPDWAPSSSQIVYHIYYNGGDDLWKVSATGAVSVLITNGAIPEEHPVWSPQGDKIAFIRGMFNAAEVYTMLPDGTGVTRITNNTVLDGAPSWQPIPGPATYVRPKTAATVRVPLVPAYRPCKTGNRTHGPPWVYPSCNPPKAYSRYLTSGSPDVNGAGANMTAFAKITGIPGNAGTPADEADVRLQLKISDVRKKSDLTDYTGQLRMRAEFRRQTDKENAVGAASPTEAATLTDAAWNFTVQCAATADTSIGSNCDLTTTRDAITPGSIKESKRLVVGLGRIQVWDGGADGQNSTQVNDLFLTQGIYIP